MRRFVSDSRKGVWFMTVSDAKVTTGAWYALRRTLPPWRFEQALDELIEQLPRYHVEELIVKVDTEDFSHGHPSIRWLRDYLPNLHAVREALEKLGIVYSLNPWVTLLHADRGWNLRDTLPDGRTMVGHDGNEARACVCPLCPSWKQYIAQLWQLYAQTHPKVIWIEDDIRTFNHDPVRYGCFCPLHLQRFSERMGRHVTRDELVTAMLRPGDPDPCRAAYLNIQADIMIDTARHLARAIHAVDPAINLGLMSSGHYQHAIEGRRWSAFAEALADGRPLYSRPPLGNYHEATLRGLYLSQDSIKGCRHVMPAGAIDQTEVENIPFGPYANSTLFTFLKMAVGFAYGATGVTLNLFSHDGAPMEDDPHVGSMLAERKPMLDALANAVQQPGRYRGVGLLHHERASAAIHLPAGATYDDLLVNHLPAMEQLEAHGIPTTYEPEPVIAAPGQILRAFDDTAIEAMLGTGRGLLIDAVGAGVLIERGFAELIGVERIAPPRPACELGLIAAEHIEHPAFGGGTRAYLTLRTTEHANGPSVSVMSPVADAQVISRFVDADTQPHCPAAFAFENRLGGRVVVQTYDLETAYHVNYCRPARRDMLHAIIRWLWHNESPLLLHVDGAWPLALRRDGEDTMLVGCFNLSLDDWPNAVFELDGDRRIDPAGAIRTLSDDGRWLESTHIRVADEGNLQCVSYGQAVSHRQPLFIQVPLLKTKRTGTSTRCRRNVTASIAK